MSESTYITINDRYFYDPKDLLTKESFVNVYKAFDKSTLSPVVIKAIPASKLQQIDNQPNPFLREVDIMRKIKGEHIVQLVDAIRTEHYLYIITEYCDGGDLEKKLQAKHIFTEEEACSIIKQIADAFIYIEYLNIKDEKGEKLILMHRDIKPANILFHQGKVKLADFGFSKLIQDTERYTKQTQTIMGTPTYMSPQVMGGHDYSSKCDIWSIGVVFYEMLFGKLPWIANSLPNLYKSIRSIPLTFPKVINSKIKELIWRMLSIPEEGRPSWEEVYDHPALEEIDLEGDFLSTEESESEIHINKEYSRKIVAQTPLIQSFQSVDFGTRRPGVTIKMRNSDSKSDKKVTMLLKDVEW